MSSAMDHTYTVTVSWTGNNGGGTADYRSYGRDHDIVVEGKPVLAGSADPLFRGDRARHNPEDLLVASLSACHMLWYLHLCAEAGVVVTAYEDRAEGKMVFGRDGSGGHFEEVILRPRIAVTAASDASVAAALHADAHAKCFIANSVNFPVRHKPEISREGGT